MRAHFRSPAKLSIVPIACLLLVFVPQASSRAALNSIEIVPVAQNVIPNSSTYDVLINGTGQLLGLDIRIELAAGSLFQEGLLGSHTPPDSTMFPVAPALQFDTFVGMGGRTSGTTLPFTLIDNTLPLPGMGPLDLFWAPAITVSDPVDFFVARLTLSNDAEGTIRLRHLPPGGTPDFEQTFAIPIVGSLPIPEPTTVSVAAVGLLALAQFRKSKRLS